MLHELKTHPDPFAALMLLTKTFEYRKDDRDYQVDDILILKEYHPFTQYSGRRLIRKVTYVIRNEFGIPPGYCIMSVRPLTPEEESNHAAGISQEQRRENPALSL